VVDRWDEPAPESRQRLARRHGDLIVYQRAFDAAVKIFHFTKRFPKDETYSLTDQIRRSSRSVCANLAEAWRKRRYPAAFVAKLADAEGEAAETQVWLQFAQEFGYLDAECVRELSTEYDAILGMIVKMLSRPGDWKL
jgi:four helix bundle protein